MKGQVSLEFLFVYGIGLVIIVASLVLAWQTGLFSGISPQQRGIEGFSQVKVNDFKAKGNFLNLTLENNAPDPVTVRGVNASIGNEVWCNSTPEVNITPGSKALVELSCPQLEQKYPSGKYYKANIMIDYLNIRSNQLHESRGTIWGTVE